MGRILRGVSTCCPPGAATAEMTLREAKFAIEDLAANLDAFFDLLSGVRRFVADRC